MDYLRINNLERHVTTNISITASLLRKVLEGGMYGERNLGTMLLSMANITAQTKREMSCIVYTRIPKEIEIYRNAGSLSFLDFRIVPSLGDLKTVPDPDFYPVEMYKDLMYDQNDREIDPFLVLPIIHVHTHPTVESFTSEGDLKNVQARYNIDFSAYYQPNIIANPTLNIIIGTSTLPSNPYPWAHNFTFYQFSGNTPALEAFLGEYNTHHAEALKIAQNERGSRLVSAFMERLKAAGVCKYLHFPNVNFPASTKRSLFQPGENSALPKIQEKHLVEITQQFAFTAQVQKTFLSLKKGTN